MPIADQPAFPVEEVLDFDLTCPSCGVDLTVDHAFLTTRVCGACGRHFSLAARERIALLADSGSFDEFQDRDLDRVTHGLPEAIPSAERLAEHHESQVIAEAVVSGSARIGGSECVLLALDDHLVGPSLGATMAEKVIAALTFATARKLPVVMICVGGGTIPSAGPLSVVQAGRLSSAFAQLHLAGLSVIGTLVHPVAESMYALLATHCDVLFAEPGVLVGTPDMVRVREGVAPWRSAEDLLARGWIDAIVPRIEFRHRATQVLDMLTRPGFVQVPQKAFAQNVAAITTGGLGNSQPFLDHPDRPRADTYLTELLRGFVELRGDRVLGDTAAVLTGFARFDSLAIAVVIIRNNPANESDIAARKIARLARLGSRHELPIVALIDERLGDDVRGYSLEGLQAGSTLGSLLSVLPVAVISIVIGAVVSPLSRVLLTGDRQFMLSNAVLASDEDQATGSVVFGRHSGPRPPKRAALSAYECERLGLIDAVIEEPAAGSHSLPEGTIAAVHGTLAGALAELNGTGPRRLLDTRFRRQRDLGMSTPEGLDAVRSEHWEMQEWQRSLERSLGDWRDRWEHFRAGSNRDQSRRLDMPEVMTRFRARRDGFLTRTGIGDRLGNDSAADSNQEEI